MACCAIPWIPDSELSYARRQLVHAQQLIRRRHCYLQAVLLSLENSNWDAILGPIQRLVIETAIDCVLGSLLTDSILLPWSGASGSNNDACRRARKAPDAVGASASTRFPPGFGTAMRSTEQTVHLRIGAATAVVS